MAEQLQRLTCALDHLQRMSVHGYAQQVPPTGFHGDVQLESVACFPSGRFALWNIDNVNPCLQDMFSPAEVTSSEYGAPDDRLIVTNCSAEGHFQLRLCLFRIYYMVTARMGRSCGSGRTETKRGLLRSWRERQVYG